MDKLVIIFGAGGDDPIPTTGLFRKAIRIRNRKEKIDRIKWIYLYFSAYFFAPIFGGGQVIAHWIMDRDAKVVTTNWSRSIERELRRLTSSKSILRKNKNKIIRYYDNKVNVSSKKLKSL